ncbi:MAG: SHOCT domain-containing protein [Burkholderiaceae bacterium]|nr:SHOCT domain-containing protein [Burkholderiaceae bacterium]
MMWGDYGMGWSGGWGVFGMIHMVLWWVLIIVLIVVLLKWIGRRTGGAAGRPEEDSAMRILREMYARGEITKEVFEQKKRDLGT